VSGHLIADQRTAVTLGALAVFVGSLLLWDAYEARGKRRPFLLNMLPGA
jgi:hypothetical protein